MRLKSILLVITLILLASTTAHASTLWLSGNGKVEQLCRSYVALKTTANNFIAFQVSILIPEGVDVVDVKKGRDLNGWTLSYTIEDYYEEIDGTYYNKRLEIVGIGKKPPIGRSKELALIAIKPIITKNLTLLIDKKNTKFVDLNGEEIKINKFYNYRIVTYKYGDVNMDGSVDIGDLVKLKRIILMRENSTITSDLNDDGKVNILDLVRLIQVLVGS